MCHPAFRLRSREVAKPDPGQRRRECDVTDVKGGAVIQFAFQPAIAFLQFLHIPVLQRLVAQMLRPPRSFPA